MKILIDENLSPTLVERLAAKGVPALHIVHLGLAGASDPELWRYAFEKDLVVVTVNVRDFLTLAAASEIHPGLIAIRAAGADGLTTAETWAWLEPVIDHVLAAGIDLVNNLVEVRGPGDYEIRDLPPP